MNLPRTLLALALVAGFPALSAEEKRSGAAPPAVPVEERGLAIGQAAPPFQAVDQFGRRRNLGSLMGSRGLVLLFVRSADW